MIYLNIGACILLQFVKNKGHINTTALGLNLLYSRLSQLLTCTCFFFSLQDRPSTCAPMKRKYLTKLHVVSALRCIVANLLWVILHPDTLMRNHHGEMSQMINCHQLPEPLTFTNQATPLVYQSSARLSLTSLCFFSLKTTFTVSFSVDTYEWNDTVSVTITGKR